MEQAKKLVALGYDRIAERYQHDWLGVPMFWSSFDAPSARAAIADAGFRIISLAEETVDEDGVPVPFLWVQTKRPG